MILAHTTEQPAPLRITFGSGHDRACSLEGQDERNSDAVNIQLYMDPGGLPTSSSVLCMHGAGRL